MKRSFDNYYCFLINNNLEVLNRSRDDDVSGSMLIITGDVQLFRNDT